MIELASLEGQVLGAMLFAGLGGMLALSLAGRRIWHQAPAVLRRPNDSRLFEAFIDAAPDAIVIVDEAGKIIIANQRAEALLGYEAGEMLGMTVETLVPERARGDHGRWRDDYGITPKVRSMSSRLDLKAVRKDGTEVPVEIGLSPIRNGSALVVSVIMRDVSHWKQVELDLARSKAELEQRVVELEDVRERMERNASDAVDMAEELSQAKSQLHDAVANISEGFALWDENDKLIMCNDMYRAIYAALHDMIEEGCGFEDFVRAAYDRGLFRQGESDREAAVQERVARHRRLDSSFEEQWNDGRWIRVSKRRTQRGHVVGIITDISERKVAEATIQRMALEDALTGLPNRVQFLVRLKDALAQADRTGDMVGVMLLDLDNFKNVNDSFGHPSGDALLRQVARRLTRCARKSDTVARLGGDEFALIVNNAKSPDDVILLGQRIVKALSQPFKLGKNVVRSGTSIGITIYPNDCGDTDQLLLNADCALYRSKAEGRGTCTTYDEEMDRELRARRALEDDLRRALERNEFRVVYQPQISAATGQIVGAEALLRWRHPERGDVAPADFIPIAEATRLIIPISDWLLRTVCAQSRAWQDAGLTPVSISVNISPVQFMRPGLVSQLTRVLSKAGLDSSWLELEITEGLAVAGGDETLGILTELKRAGIGLAIDDFGTGYSSLNRLKKFPVDRLKIDQSFVRDITVDQGDAAICSAIIRLGHSLGIRVIAEGVETAKQAAFLLREGCDELQGFLFGVPLETEDFAAFVMRRPAPNISANPRLQAPSEAPKRASGTSKVAC